MAARKEAYVTMITSDDFLPGAEALLASLKDSQDSLETRAVICMVTASVTSRVRAKLTGAGATVVEVDSISIPQPSIASSGGAVRTLPSATTHVESWVATGYSKLNLWSLGAQARGGFEAVVYVDADAVVLEDLGPVFQRLGETCPLAAAPDVFPPDRFNAGVLGLWLGPRTQSGEGVSGASGSSAAAVTSVGEKVLADMQARLADLGTYDGGDTGFLNRYFSDWYTRPTDARLPFRYNAQRTLHWLTHDQQPGYWAEACQSGGGVSGGTGGSPAVLHFSSSPKPWQSPDKKGELELVWWKYFMQAQLGCALPPDIAAAMVGF